MSGCSCIFVEGDGDTCVVYPEENPRARREHKCDECDRVIKKGEYYFKERFLYDGDFETQKTCTDCMSVRKAFFCSFAFGTLWDEMEYHIECEDGQLSSEAILSCTPAARYKIFDIIDRMWSE